MTQTHSELVLRPLQWSNLADINDIRPIDESDSICLEEIRQVLLRHNCLERFGISLLHSHFDVAADEMLLETTDIQKREHWVRPVKKSFLTENGFTAQPTIINFDENGANQYCGCVPWSGGHGHTQPVTPQPYQPDY
jgi:hypothetical protein